MIYVLIFLVSIILANLSVAYFGPQSAIINAFILIGLDLTLRDKIHENWHGKNLGLRMLGLLVASGILTYFLNRGAGRIAIASVSAFCGALLVDALIYERLFGRKFLIKVNGSNIGSALIDSILFPTIAFGSVMPLIIFGQFIAKVGGGFMWSLVIAKLKSGSEHSVAEK